MNNRIARLSALALILLVTVSAASAKRLLLPPPEGYKGVEINGVKFVVGQVYIPQYSDTVKLKQFGFRAFDAMGSSHTYRKVKAVWPLDLDLNALPEWISGLTYEKAHSIEEMEQAYTTGSDKKISAESIGTLFNIYGNQYNNYGGRMNVSERSRTPGDPNYRLNNYGWVGSGRQTNVGRYNYNEYGYRYNTYSPTLLTPTTIESYYRNPYIRPYWGCGR